MSTPTLASSAPKLHVRLDDRVPVIELPVGLSFEQLRSLVREVLPQHLDLIAGRTTRLDLGARRIQLLDLRRLVNLLRNEFQVDITGLYVQPDAAFLFAERELKLKLFFPTEQAPPPAESPAPQLAPAADLDEEEDSAPEAVIERVCDELDPAEPAAIQASEAQVTETPEVPPAPAPTVTNAPTTPVGAVPRMEGRRSKTLARTLRSGTSVRFDGDITIFGDVNPGANVIASGTIVVLGTLKGMAHAGAAGDETARIFALELAATQLRIARKIAIPPAGRPKGPEVASIRDESIVLEPYGRTRA